MLIIFKTWNFNINIFFLKLLIIPGYEICTVKAIEVHDKSCKFASAGDTVSLGITGIDTNNIG